MGSAVTRVFLLLALSTAASAWADDDVVQWVREQVREQKAAVPSRTAAADGGVALFRERSARSTIPDFVPPSSLAPLVKAVRAGVVNISTRNESGAAKSLGSGFVITPDGLVVTNNHVIDRSLQTRVLLNDGRELDAVLVGRDPSTDLALLRLEGQGDKPVPTVFLGDSDQLEVGDWVVAIGNPFGLETSVTHGIISARERVIGLGPFDDFIQTNALINPGNSGGPLFNMRGEVVGVCSAIVQQAQGIGFAVPINLVKDLLPNLMDNGRLERGWLGLNIQEAAGANGRSAVVVDVVAQSPAANAGIQPGDLVLAVGGKPVESYLQLLRRIALNPPGSTVKLKLSRAGKVLELTAMLGERPAAEAMRVLAGAGRLDAFGLVVKDLSPAALKQLGGEGGALVAAVVPSGPADAAGLQPGDLITEVNRQKVTDLPSLNTAFATSKDATALVKYRRGQSAQYVVVRRAQP